MTDTSPLPRILVIDDLLGRTVAGGLNVERRNLCAQYLLVDETGDEHSGDRVLIHHPIAEAVFCRAQQPATAVVGDVISNDLEGTLRFVGEATREGQLPLSLVMLDLCFYTGRVTTESNGDASGMAEGSADDDDPASYFGLQLLSEIGARFPELPVVILSNQPREEVSREFASRGALAFLPRVGTASREIFREILWKYGLIADPRGKIVGSSMRLLLSLRAARQAAQSRRNVLIRGERGCGKELVADYIHRESRGSSAFIVVDSGALSPALYASELFGHRRGAFTGADSARVGKILLAADGDLFLDEIGNMPMDVQSGLLRVLEQREVLALGATTGQKVDVRFLSATNEDLEARQSDGTFRRDLYDRLCDGAAISLPPLRERPGDIPLLATKFLADAGAQFGLKRRQEIEPSALDALQNYSWPGNVRELQSMVIAAAFRYGDVEHLFSNHFFSRGLSLNAPTRDPVTSQVQLPETQELPALLHLLRNSQREDIAPESIGKTYQEIELEISRARAALLRAALKATQRRTPDHPEGEILIHPAAKLLLGDSKVSALKAADLIKRIISSVEREISDDPVLREAWDRAIRLRPHITQSKLKKDRRKSS